VCGAMKFVDVPMDDRLEDMIREVEVESFAEAVFENMYKDLYPSSTNFTRLSTVLRLMNLKAMNGWTDKSFIELLQLLNECF